MKSLVAAIGALALATSFAQAEPVARGAAAAPAVASVSSGYRLSAARPEDGGAAVDRTVNQGAGTSRSSDANQG